MILNLMNIHIKLNNIISKKHYYPNDEEEANLSHRRFFPLDSLN